MLANASGLSRFKSRMQPFPSSLQVALERYKNPSCQATAAK